jgi:hypothetical protein
MPDDRRPGVLQGDFARKLLQDDRPDATDVEKLLRNRMKNRHGEPLQGDNAVLLAGLTCRQAGGDAWTAFRDSKPFLLGNQQLEGGTLTLLGRLGRGKLVPRK